MGYLISNVRLGTLIVIQVRFRRRHVNELDEERRWLTVLCAQARFVLFTTRKFETPLTSSSVSIW